jgi:hypothetical protein
MIAATICWLAPGHRDRWVGVFSGMWRRKEESRQVQVRGRRTSHFALASTDRRVWRRVRACGVNAAGGGQRATGDGLEREVVGGAKRETEDCHDFGVAAESGQVVCRLLGSHGAGWFWVVLGVGRDCGSGECQGRASVRAGGLKGTKIGWALGKILHYIELKRARGEDLSTYCAQISRLLSRLSLEARCGEQR